MRHPSRPNNSRFWIGCLQTRWTAGAWSGLPALSRLLFGTGLMLSFPIVWLLVPVFECFLNAHARPFQFVLRVQWLTLSNALFLASRNQRYIGELLLRKKIIICFKVKLTISDIFELGIALADVDCQSCLQRYCHQIKYEVAS